jgi:hypothetical protein
MAEIIGTGVQISGKTSRISADSTVLSLAKFNVVEEGQDIDTVNFDSDGFGEGILGIQFLRWTLGGLWDAGTNPLDDPPGIYVRDDLPDLILYLNVSDDQAYTMDYARVRSSTVGTDVHGAATFDASGMSQGEYILPEGSVA